MATVPNRAIFFTAWTDTTTAEYFPLNTNALITDQAQLNRIDAASVAWLDPTFDPATLDAKLDASEYTASDVLAKLLTVDGDASGLAAQTASKLSTARTISLSGDASGYASFDGSGNVTINVAVQDDSHAHIVGNVDGLQAALDAKADLVGGKLTPTQLPDDVGGGGLEAKSVTGSGTLVAGESIIVDASGGTADRALPTTLDGAGRYIIKAKGGSVRITPTTHTIRYDGAAIGGTGVLVLAAGETVHLQEDGTTAVEIM